MRDERDNVRAALAFHHAAGDAESLARTCAGEWFLWFFVGDPVEGAEWLRRALELGPPRHLLSPVENAYAAVLMVSGEEAESAELAASTQLASAALRHAREIGDVRAEFAALITLGNGLSARRPRRPSRRDRRLDRRRIRRPRRRRGLVGGLRARQPHREGTRTR